MSGILIVDDNSELRDIYKRLAERLEAGEVKTASSAHEACRLIKQYDFDLVVTDLSMDHRDSGLHVLDAAKRKDPNTQVIVATVFGTPEVSSRIIKGGAFDYLLRNSAGTNFFEMLAYKMGLALSYRQALAAEHVGHG